MEVVHGYWPAIVIAIVFLIILALLIFRPRQRVTLSESAPVRPHMQQAAPREGRGIAGEAAAATSDLTGDIIRAPVHRALDGEVGPHDDLCAIKGIGPKFADALHSAGFTRFDQLAQLTPTEVDRLDSRLGSFAGRIARDRIVEQADYLARNDIDGFEQKFGKL